MNAPQGPGVKRGLKVMRDGITSRVCVIFPSAVLFMPPLQCEVTHATGQSVA